jgi:ABC-type dipeptide/oligopeptide/nickel transport system permease subunit
VLSFASIGEATAATLGRRRRRRAGAGSRSIRIGGGIVLALALAGLLAPLLSPHDPLQQFAGQELAAPGNGFLLGSDQLGRDVLSRTLYGCRSAILVGLIGVGIGSLVGTTIGIVSGYFGGLLDSVIQRVTDVAFGFPVIIVGIVIVALSGAGQKAVVMAIAIYNVPVFVRILRGAALQVRARPFIEAAFAMGLRDREILVRHILPSVLPVFAIQVGLALPDAVLLDAGLSFVGLGAPPPAPTLGGMLDEARAYLSSPMIAIVPGIALCLLVVGLNMLADGVRDRLDPRGMLRGTTL